jgi:predicted heme/steroid binding protein
MSQSFSARAEAEPTSVDGPRPVPPRRYTRAALARYNGADPALPVLIAYKGKVYDVTASFPWARGSHWGDLRAGEDLTGKLMESIHGEEMLARVPCVGVLDQSDDL